MTFKRYYQSFLLTFVAVALLFEVIPCGISYESDVVVTVSALIIPIVLYYYVFFMRRLWRTQK